jgi:integrase
MRKCLALFASWFGRDLMDWEPQRLNVIGVRAIVERIRQQGWKPATAAKHEAALAGLIKSCWRLGLLDSDTAHRMRDWSRIRVQRATHHQAAGRYITLDERKALWQSAGSLGATKVAIVRDRAFLTLLLCGMRREECVRLERRQLSPDGVLTVLGKGGKERQLVLEPWTMEALQGWLNVRGEEPGAFLRPVDRHGNLGKGYWAPIGASKRFEAILKKAGVANVTPHDARRTYASDALANGVDIGQVARWMGHSDVRTTASYDRRGLDQLRAAARAVARPF